MPTYSQTSRTVGMRAPTNTFSQPQPYSAGARSSFATGGAILHPGSNLGDYGFGSPGQTQNPSVFPGGNQTTPQRPSPGGMAPPFMPTSGGASSSPSLPDRPSIPGNAAPGGTGSGNFRPSPGGQPPSVPGVPGLGSAGGGAGMTVPGFQNPGQSNPVPGFQYPGGGSGTAGMMIPEVGGAANQGQPGSQGFQQLRTQGAVGEQIPGYAPNPLEPNSLTDGTRYNPGRSYPTQASGLRTNQFTPFPEAQNQAQLDQFNRTLSRRPFEKPESQYDWPAWKQRVASDPSDSWRTDPRWSGKGPTTDNFTGQNYRQFTHPDGTNYMADRSYFAPSGSTPMSPARQNFLSSGGGVFGLQQPNEQPNKRPNEQTNAFGQNAGKTGQLPSVSPNEQPNKQPNRMTLDQQMAQRRSGELASRTQGPQGGTTGSVSSPSYQQNIQNMNAGRTAGGNTQTLNQGQYDAMQRGGSPMMSRGGNQTSYYQPFNRPTPGDPGTWVSGTSHGALGNTGSAPGSHNTWRPPQANQQQGQPSAYDQYMNALTGGLNSLVQSGTDQMNAYNAATNLRDDQIRGLLGQRSDNLFNWQGQSAGNLAEQYKNRENYGMEIANTIGAQTLQDVDDRFRQERARANSSAINRGMANTTIRDSVNAGITRQETNAYGDALDRIARLRLGAYSGLSGDTLQAGQALHNQKVGLLQQVPMDLINYMERIDPVPPDMNAMIQLAAMAGRSGGIGGMGGLFGGPQYAGGGYSVPNYMYGNPGVPSYGNGFMGGFQGFPQGMGNYNPYANIPPNPYQPGDPNFIGPVPGGSPGGGTQPYNPPPVGQGDPWGDGSFTPIDPATGLPTDGSMGGTQPTGTPGGGPAGGATGGGAQAPPLFPPIPGDPWSQDNSYTPVDSNGMPIDPNTGMYAFPLPPIAPPAPPSPPGIPTPQANAGTGQMIPQGDWSPWPGPPQPVGSPWGGPNWQPFVEQNY